MITKEQAVSASYRDILYHVQFKNKDGSRTRCRVNGKCKTWKTKPKKFKLPVKYGMYECFYITEDNAEQWEITNG